MRVRAFEKRDVPKVEQIFRDMGFDYEFPDLSDPIFERVSVLVDDDDSPVQVLAAKKTVEMYLLMDKDWANPRWRLEGFKRIHEEMRMALLDVGYADANAWLPPEVEKSFGRKLVRLFKWTRGRWQSYSRNLKD